MIRTIESESGGSTCSAGSVAYARQRARRHMVICDAHTPTGGVRRGGQTPFRRARVSGCAIAEVAVSLPRPFSGSDTPTSSIRRAKWAVTPEWLSCDHLPTWVEFDNFGATNPGQTSTALSSGLGRKITWFATTPKPSATIGCVRVGVAQGQRSIAHLEMPGSRCCHPGPRRSPLVLGETQSAAGPNGFNHEETIRELWGTTP